MAFWIIALGLACVVGLTLAAPLLSRRRSDVAVADYDLRVYRDQLKEIDRDLERGVLSAEDAERVRAEVSRRILAADTNRDAAISADSGRGRGTQVTAAVLGVIVFAGSGFLYQSIGNPGFGDLPLQLRIEQAEDYRENRPSQLTAEAQTPDIEPSAEVNAEFLALIDRLRNVVAERPNDAQGHRLLAENEARLGNFKAAYEAQAQVIEIKGAEASATDYADLADMMFWAAGGYVSPEAENVLERAIALDPTQGTARYYYGLMMGQTGRPDRAFTIWRQQLTDGPPEAPWIPLIQAQIEQVALRAGVNYSPIEVGTGTRGPDQADIEAAGEMSPAERLQMIEGMVSGLSERLATEGGTAREWAQLITALGVLGRRGEAAAIYDEAKTLFAEDPSALDTMTRAADRAGIGE